MNTWLAMLLFIPPPGIGATVIRNSTTNAVTPRKPVAKLGQVADQRHLGAIALLLVLFSHNASALCQRFGRAVVPGVGRDPVAGLARRVADFLDVVG